MELNLDIFGGSEDFSPFDADPNKEEKISVEIEDKKVNEDILDEEKDGVIDDENLFKSDDNQEGVDDEVIQEDEDIIPDGDDNSPNFYASLAQSLLGDGILTLDESEIKNVNDADGFIKVLNEQMKSMLDNTQKRIAEALDNNVPIDEVKQFENVLSYLDGIEESNLKDESEDGETLRKQIIYQDYVNKGFSKERAEREVVKSFNAGTDIEDALFSLTSNKEYFDGMYKQTIEKSKLEKENQIKKQEELENKFKEKVLNTDELYNGISLTKQQRENILTKSSKIVGKDNNGNSITELQKYAIDNPLDYQYNINMLYHLTNGFKDLSKVIDSKVNKQTKSKLSNLERVLKNPPLNINGDIDFSNDKSVASSLGISYANV